MLQDLGLAHSACADHIVIVAALPGCGLVIAFAWLSATRAPCVRFALGACIDSTAWSAGGHHYRVSEPFESPGALAAFYAELLAEHGDGPSAVGWNSGFAQIVNFMNLVELDGFESGVSVLDVGCGLGDFKTFLDRRSLRVEYTGWDICEPLIERARRRHPGVRFEHRDILAAPAGERFDVVVCSGLLNLRVQDHDRWVADVLRAMYRVCRRGMSFNMLSSHHAAANPFSVDTSFYYCIPPEQVVRFCLELSPHVEVSHRDMAHAFAVHVSRPSERPVYRLLAELGLGRGFGPEHRMIVEYFVSLGLHEELITWLEALETSADVYHHIGLAALALGDEVRAREAFERAVDLDPRAIEPLMHLGVMYLRGEEAARACELLERVGAISPDDATIAYRLACAYEAADRVADAAAAYRRVLMLAPEHTGASAALTRLQPRLSSGE